MMMLVSLCQGSMLLRVNAKLLLFALVMDELTRHVQVRFHGACYSQTAPF